MRRRRPWIEPQHVFFMFIGNVFVMLKRKKQQHKTLFFSPLPIKQFNQLSICLRSNFYKIPAGKFTTVHSGPRLLIFLLPTTNNIYIINLELFTRVDGDFLGLHAATKISNKYKLQQMIFVVTYYLSSFFYLNGKIIR